MLRLLLLLFAATASAATPDCIFADGFERCPDVIIGYGSYGYAGQQVIGSSTGGAFLSDSSYLFDGKPGTVTNIQWIGGTQTLSSYTAIEFGMGIPPVTTGGDVPIGVVAVLNTSLPEGLGVVLKVDGAVVQISSMQKIDPNGRTSCWFIFPVTQTNNGYVTIEFHNVVGGNPDPVMEPNQAFTIGEIFAGNVAEFCSRRTQKYSWELSPRVRQSAAGVSYPAGVPIMPNLSVALKPMKQKDTFTNTAPLNAAAVIREIFKADCVAIIPQLKFDPAVYGPSSNIFDPALVAETAFLGTFANAPTIQGNETRYEISMAFKASV